MDYEEWMADAECTRAQDPDIFFPQGEFAYIQIRAAKAYCDRCLVAAECLEYALRHKIDEGIFAGTSGRQRQRLRLKSA